jgi:citrate lyase subunit beta/citryl-CoA lyase
MLENAATLAADQVFLDLEDAVAPLEKTDKTRQYIVDALINHSWLTPTKVVRVNGVDTPWCLRDITYIVKHAGTHVDLLMIPKVETAADVHFVDRLLSQLERELELTRPIGLEVQIESALGLVNVEAIASASSRIEALIFGPGDFAADIGMRQLSVGAPEPEYPGDHWHYVRWRILVAARSFGLQAIDGPFAQFRDAESFRLVARRAQLLGYDGKWAIHPDQIALCNEVFSPTRDEYDRAERILAAYEQATDTDRRGAVMFEGEMVDEASRKMALRVVALQRAAERSS